MPTSTDPMLRLRLDEIREERGLTQEQMAAVLRKDPGQVAQWERGTTGFTRETIRGLAERLEMNAWELIRHPATSDPDVRELVRIVSQLSPAGRRAVLSQARWAVEEGLVVAPEPPSNDT